MNELKGLCLSCFGCNKLENYNFIGTYKCKNYIKGDNKMSIKTNKIKCKFCGDIIESKSVHDFKFCKCHRVAVDGGHEYLRRCFQEENDYIELSEEE